MSHPSRPPQTQPRARPFGNIFHRRYCSVKAPESCTGEPGRGDRVRCRYSGSQDVPNHGRKALSLSRCHSSSQRPSPPTLTCITHHASRLTPCVPRPVCHALCATPCVPRPACHALRATPCAPHPTKSRNPQNPPWFSSNACVSNRHVLRLRTKRYIADISKCHYITSLVPYTPCLYRHCVGPAAATHGLPDPGTHVQLEPRNV